jgi:ubiquinone/menaquinone biosynthesis C-methylase UbiE
MESTNHRQEIVSQFTRQARPFAEIKAHSEQRSLDVFHELGRFSGKERVLDSGCGPGLVSCYLSKFVGTVVGMDLTPAMLQLATESATEAALGNVYFIAGNMTALPFLDEHFEASVTRYTFHHLENPKVAFSEMVRVTRPKGRIIVVDVTPEESKRGAYDEFERLRDTSHTSSLTFAELTGLGRDHGLAQPDIIQFGLEMDAETLIASSFPEAVSREHLLQLLKEDIQKDSLSFRMREENGSFIMTFPVTAAGWQLS